MGFDYSVMKFIQSLGGAADSAWQKFMDTFFIASTFLCEEMFLLLVIFIIYWAINKKLGENLILILLATIGINGLFKVIIGRYRPFTNSDYSSLRYIEVDNFFVNTTHLNTSYSFPSGHSQLAGSLFGGFALYIKKNWVYVVMGILILLVMISRVYLGVHYPTDVIVGGVLGVLIAVIMSKVTTKYPDKKVIILSVLFGILVVTFIYELITDAISAGDTIKMVGLAAGGIPGFLWEEKKINFKVDGLWWKRTIRVILGFVLVMIVRIVLKPIFEIFTGDNTALIMTFDAVRYALVGVTATALWPLIFTKVKL